MRFYFIKCHFLSYQLSMRKILFVFLTAFICLSFCSCKVAETGGNNYIPDNSQPVVAPKTVLVSHIHTKTWRSTNEAFFEVKLNFDNQTNNGVKIMTSGFVMIITYGGKDQALQCELYLGEKATPASLNSITVLAGAQQKVFLVGKVSQQNLAENTPFNVELIYNETVFASETLKMFKINYQ